MDTSAKGIRMCFNNGFDIGAVASAHVDDQRNGTIVTTRDYSNIAVFTTVECKSHAPEFITFKYIYATLKEYQLWLDLFEEFIQRFVQ